MTQSDFYLIRNSITMRQLVDYYGFRIDRKHYIPCPFHNEKTASLQIFDEYRGFHCKGCGVGGDVIRFVELYEEVRPSEAVKLLSERFGIVTSDNGEVSQAALHRAKQAEIERNRLFVRQLEIRGELRHLATLIKGYEGLIDGKLVKGESWCYVQNELPVLKGKWEHYFELLER